MPRRNYTHKELAQGTVEGMPRRTDMKWVIAAHHRQEKPFRITLVDNQGRREVEFLTERSYGVRSDGSWHTVNVFCAVGTHEEPQDVRIIRIDVDADGQATFY